MISNRKDMKQIKNRKGLKAVLILALLVMLTGLGSCYRDKADQVYPGTNAGGVTCDTTNVTYSGTIKGIVEQHCSITGCHDGNSYPAYPMRTRDEIYANCVQTNKLLGSIRHESGFVAMPQGAVKLDDCTINKITAWVNNGALNN